MLDKLSKIWYNISYMINKRGGHIMENGWVKAPREIMDTWIWNDGVKFCKFKAFMDLMFCANYREKEVAVNGEIKEVKIGSFITSAIKLSQRWGWERRAVMRFLKMLTDAGYIAYERAGKGTMITVKKLDNSAVSNFFAEKNVQQMCHNNAQHTVQEEAHEMHSKCDTTKEYNNIKKEYKNNGIREEAEEEDSA